MAALATQQIAVTGTAPAYAAAAAGGDTVAPGDATFLHVKNGSAAAVTVTVAVPGSEYGQARPDVDVAVPAAGDRMIHLPRELADPSDQRIHITYSATASVTVAALAG